MKTPVTLQDLSPYLSGTSFFRYTNPYGDIYVGQTTIMPADPNTKEKRVSGIILEAQWIQRVRKAVDVDNSGCHHTVWKPIPKGDRKNYRLCFHNPRRERASNFLVFLSEGEKVEICLATTPEHHEIIKLVSEITEAATNGAF